MNKVDMRTVIADRLEHQAQWRTEKALEYPEDDRNARAANAMMSTAEYVRALPGNDARLVFLAAVLDENTAGASAAYLEQLFGPLQSNVSEWHDFMDEERETWARVGFDFDGFPAQHLDALVTFYRGAIHCGEETAASRD